MSSGLEKVATLQLPAMRRWRRTQNGTSLREQIALIGVTALLCIVVFALHASDKWMAAIYCTVPTFAGMIAYFRNRVASGLLWPALSGAFLLHLVLLWLVFGLLLRQRTNVPLSICIPAIFGESFILYHMIRFFGARFRTLDE